MTSTDEIAAKMREAAEFDLAHATRIGVVPLNPYKDPANIIAIVDDRDAKAAEIEALKRAVKVCQNASRTLDAGRQEVIRNLQKPAREERLAAATLDSEREANAALTAEVAVDGSYFGGYVKPANHKENRRDRRLAENQTGKRKVVVIAREKGGKTLPFVFPTEGAAVETLGERIEVGSTVHADEARHWDALHGRYLTKRINHQESYSDDGACTNDAESFFSRIRRAEIGIHHHISGKYLSAYAHEMAWREDHRRVSNGEQYLLTVNSALAHPVSRQWKGYWQRSANH